YQAVFNAQANTVTLLALGAPAPSLRRGQWVLDASMATVPVPNTNPQQYTLVSARGFFYRIVSVSEPDAAGDVSIEVQTPLRGWNPPDLAFPVSTDPDAPGQVGTVIIFDNLIEVFEDGTF